MSTKSEKKAEKPRIFYEFEGHGGATVLRELSYADGKLTVVKELPAELIAYARAALEGWLDARYR